MDDLSTEWRNRNINAKLLTKGGRHARQQYCGQQKSLTVDNYTGNASFERRIEPSLLYAAAPHFQSTLCRCRLIVLCDAPSSTARAFGNTAPADAPNGGKRTRASFSDTSYRSSAWGLRNVAASASRTSDCSKRRHFRHQRRPAASHMRVTRIVWLLSLQLIDQ